MIHRTEPAVSDDTTDPSGPRPPTLRIADGGLETTLVFLEGLDLEDFAAFPLILDPDGRRILRRYYEPFLQLAADLGVGMVLDTPTWRANPDWGARLGFDADALFDVNCAAVEIAKRFAAGHADVVINGVVGPRGDGYDPGHAMTVDEAAEYHRPQIEAFARSGVDTVTAVTMTSPDEAIGIVRACTTAGVPVIVGFTVETDGRVPTGAALGDAITRVDDATDTAAAHFMVNCAHPSHFAGLLRPDLDWCRRIGTVRANASRMSHEELDAAPELDRGDPAELAAEYQVLRRLLPNLSVVGGCCGTDLEHIVAIAAALTTEEASTR